MFQKSSKKCEETRDITKPRTGLGCHRNKKKMVASPKVVSRGMTDEERIKRAGGSENINPSGENLTARRKLLVKKVKVRSTDTEHCRVLHSVPDNNNIDNKILINKYHFFGDSIKLSDDEGIGSAESLAAEQHEN